MSNSIISFISKLHQHYINDWNVFRIFEIYICQFCITSKFHWKMNFIAPKFGKKLIKTSYFSIIDFLHYNVWQLRDDFTFIMFIVITKCMQTPFLSSVTKELCKMTHPKRAPESGIHDSFFIVFVEVLSLHEKCESFISKKNWLVNEEALTLINSS